MVRTLMAPMRLLMKVFPMTTHIIVITLTPFSTFISHYFLAVSKAQFSCKEKAFIHPFRSFLRDATATVNTKVRIMASVR